MSLQSDVISTIKTIGSSTFLAALAGILSLVFSFTLIFFEKDPTVRLKKSELSELRLSVTENNLKLSELESENIKYKNILENLINDSKNIEVVALKKQLDKQGESITLLRDSLGGDIERSLSVALLRKDLEATEKRLEKSLESSTKSVDRVYDQNKWFLGLMATMTLSVIGLSISVFSSRSKDKEKS